MEIIAILSMAIIAITVYSAVIGDDDPIDSQPYKPTKGTNPFTNKYKLDLDRHWTIPKLVKILDYDSYIKSTAWYEQPNRLLCLENADGKCGACGEYVSLEVHHIHYNNLGKEALADLSALCRECHDYTHKVAGKGAGYYPIKARPFNEIIIKD